MATEYINLRINEIRDYAEELCQEFNLKAEFSWHSKYNKYINFDYEPFDTSGFEPMLYMSGEREKIGFVTYLIEQRLLKIDYLEKCLVDNSIIKKGLFCR